MHSIMPHNDLNTQFSSVTKIDSYSMSKKAELSFFETEVTCDCQEISQIVTGARSKRSPFFPL